MTRNTGIDVSTTKETFLTSESHLWDSTQFWTGCTMAPFNTLHTADYSYFKESFEGERDYELIIEWFCIC